jgi:hypothetical protein
VNKTNLALAVVVVAAGAFYFIHDVKGKPQREEAQTQSKRVFPELKKDKLASFEVQQLKESGKAKPFHRLIVKKHGLWIEEDPKPSHALNGVMLAGSLKSLVELQRSDDLGASATPAPVLNSADYGLDKPTYTIKVKSSDGKEYAVNLGNRTPDKTGFYVQSRSSETTAPFPISPPKSSS